MDCLKDSEFAQKQTNYDLIREKLEILNDRLGLKDGKYGSMVHNGNAYGGNTLEGFTDKNSSGTTDLQTGDRLSDKKQMQLISTINNVVYYAKKHGGKL